MNEAERKARRAELRKARRSVAPGDRERFSQAIAGHAARSLMLTRARHYACFLSADGEADTTPLIKRLLARGACVWLPCLGEAVLRFRRYLPGMRMQRADFGILEPAEGAFVSARELDVVLMPLVGFDDAGNRLGMGGGYYDRSLAFLHLRQSWRRPRLVGLAFSVQRMAAMQPARWDVPLQGIITELGYRRFARRA